MFDWARGSVLKKLIGLQFYRASGEQRDGIWLKNWHVPWFLGLVELTPELSILDVGSATPQFMKYVHREYGCEVHALDSDAANRTRSNFGFSENAANDFPTVTMHVGLAGQELLPSERFDIITCISTLEHTYDHQSPMDPQNPLSHLHALRDIVRMLKPGGLFLMNWDIYLDMMPQHVGWDFEVDCFLLKAAGMRLFSNRRRLRTAGNLFAHPDTLLFDQGEVLAFKHGRPVRGTAINMLWQKPGSVTKARMLDRPDLQPFYFPPDETQPEPEPVAEGVPTTQEIDDRFRHYISRITDVLSKSDAD